MLHLKMRFASSEERSDNLFLPGLLIVQFLYKRCTNKMSTYTTNDVTLTLDCGNIIDAQVDAIVNAANAGLAGGGGVDGAIHRAAGPSVMEECRKIGDCPTGRAVATTAGKLPVRYIFHAVGPIYRQHSDDARLLVSTYQSCLELAEQHHLQSIAFPLHQYRSLRLSCPFSRTTCSKYYAHIYAQSW